MPFKTTDTLPENPAVTIFLSGLMIIQPDAQGQTCEVFVNRAALDHELSVEVREKRIGKPDVIWMRHFGPFDFLSSEEPSFGLQFIAGSPKGLGMYTGAPGPQGEETLELALDLASHQFHHDISLEVDPKGGRPSIFFNDGTFYTAEKTSEDLTIKLKKGNAALPDLDSFANLIGVSISLKGEDRLAVRWRQMGLPQVLELGEPPEGSSYEIYILNDPLYVDPQEAIKHDEFAEYYKILPSIPTNDQFALEVEIPEPVEGERGTPRTLCMCVLINR